jgi:putative flippase GtrA
MPSDNQALKKELMRFLVTGILAVGVDFSGYWLLAEMIPADIAKGSSFVMGSIVAFIFNKLWTFEHDAKLSSAAIQFACLYSLTFVANVSMNHFILTQEIEAKLLAFLVATATSTTLNFLGMKFWVFRHDTKSLNKDV